MTALDQAFIKAFSQQGRPAAAIPPRQAAPAANQPPPLLPTPSTACWRRWKSRPDAPQACRRRRAEGGRRKTDGIEVSVRDQGPEAGLKNI